MKERDLVAEVKGTLSIYEVINSRVQLKKSGKNWVSCCPFHEEKTPSFTVSPDKQMYHCFGCGASGDLIKFVMEYERIGFKEALHQLANEAGITVSNKLTKRDRILNLLETATQYYEKNFQGKSVEYMTKKRNFGEDTLKHFRIGYAPDGWHNLQEHLTKLGHSTELMIEAGLVIKKDDNIYDRFRNRVMIPIRDKQNRVIGFSGRTMGDDKPKYINSPETEVFNKSKVLFGLTKNQHDRVYIVEGQFDVMRLWEKGIKNAVASQGTALTTAHLNNINSSVGIILNFDSDEAGVTATKKAIALINNLSREATVVELPTKDVDEYFQLHENYPEPIPTFDWQLKRIEGSLEQKTEQMLSILRSLKSVSRIFYAGKCAEILADGDLKSVKHYAEYLIKNSDPLFESRPKRKVQRKTGVHKAEETILAVSVQYPDLVELIEAQLEEIGGFTLTDHRAFWRGEDVYLPEIYKPIDKDDLIPALNRLQLESAIKSRDLALELIKANPGNQNYQKLFQEECSRVSRLKLA